VKSNLISFEPLGSRAPRAKSKAFLYEGHVYLEYLQSRHSTRGLAQVLNNRVIMGGSSIWIMGRVLEYSFQNTKLWLWFLL
jgi:hypothetical protein